MHSHVCTLSKVSSAYVRTYKRNKPSNSVNIRFPVVDWIRFTYLPFHPTNPLATHPSSFVMFELWLKTSNNLCTTDQIEILLRFSVCLPFCGMAKGKQPYSKYSKYYTYISEFLQHLYAHKL